VDHQNAPQGIPVQPRIEEVDPPGTPNATALADGTSLEPTPEARFAATLVSPLPGSQQLVIATAAERATEARAEPQAADTTGRRSAVAMPDSGERVSGDFSVLEPLFYQLDPGSVPSSTLPSPPPPPPSSKQLRATDGQRARRRWLILWLVFGALVVAMIAGLLLRLRH